MRKTPPDPKGLEVDVEHAREILKKVRNPSHRYQLTMLLDVAAQEFIHLEESQSKPEEPDHAYRQRKVANAQN